jgi:hypothetical protein
MALIASERRAEPHEFLGDVSFVAHAKRVLLESSIAAIPFDSEEH